MHHCKMLYKRQRAVTVSHNKTRQVAEMTKEASTSQSDVIFVAMNDLGYSNWSVFANQDAHTFELSCSNRLILANQDAPTFALSYSNRLILANLDAHTFALSYSNRKIHANQNARALGSELVQLVYFFQSDRSPLV